MTASVIDELFPTQSNLALGCANGQRQMLGEEKNGLMCGVALEDKDMLDIEHISGQ